MSEIENNEYNTPLTKQPKVKSTSPKEIETITQEVPIKEKKSRKPKTPAQLEQFKKMYEARKLKHPSFY
jgi:hypothetical protein